MATPHPHPHPNHGRERLRAVALATTQGSATLGAAELGAAPIAPRGSESGGSSNGNPHDAAVMGATDVATMEQLEDDEPPSGPAGQADCPPYP